MLLLAASDEMSAIVAKAGGSGGAHFLVLAGASAGLLSLLHGSPFLAFLVGLFTVAGAIVLWLELLAREAAIYVVVLMLPLAFASMVWPARRKWAIRSVELLVALILSKFAIVAVLALGGAALGHGPSEGVAGMLAGFVLVTLGVFAPWALLRMLPLAELASGAVSSLRSEGRAIGGHLDAAEARAEYAGDWAALVATRLRSPLDDGGVHAESSTRSDGAAAAEAGRLKELEAGPAAGGGDDDLGGESTDGDGPGDGPGGGPADGGGPPDAVDEGPGPAGRELRAVPSDEPSPEVPAGAEPPGDSIYEPGTRTLHLGLEENWPRPDPIVMPKTAPGNEAAGEERTGDRRPRPAPARAGARGRGAVTPGRLTYRFGPLERRGILGPVRAGQALMLGRRRAAGDRGARPVPDGGRSDRRDVAVRRLGARRRRANRRADDRGVGAGRDLIVLRRVLGRARVSLGAPRRGLSARDPRPADVGSDSPRPAPRRSVRGVRDRRASTTETASIGALSERGGRTADGGARLPRRRLLAARPRGAGAAAGALGPGAVRRGEHADQANPVGRAHRPGPGRRARPLAARRARSGGAAARHADDRLLPRADRHDRQGRPRSTRSCSRCRSMRVAYATVGSRRSARALIEQTERVAQGLEAAEVTVLGALSPGQLARALRTAFDPYARSELAALETADPDRDGLAEANAWPLGARERWDHYRSDGAVHATYWIGGWPRVDVSPMFMDALLGRSSAVRTVAVTFEPISAGALDARGRSRGHPRSRRPRASAAGSGSPRPLASARRRTPRSAARRSSPPVTARCAWPAS